METENIKKLQKYMETEIVKKLNRFMETNIESSHIYYKNFIQIVELLLDLEKSSFLYFSAKEVAILRAQLGIIDKNILHKTKDLDYFLKNIKNKLNILIFNNLDMSINKMSSYRGFEKASVNELNLPIYLEKLLIDNNIYTLEQLLSFSKIELMMIIPKLGPKKMIILDEYVKFLKLRFLDDLSLEEKSAIVYKSSSEQILNSSIFWIDSFSEKELHNFDSKFGFVGYRDIGDLVKLLNSTSLVSQTTVEKAGLIGINLYNGTLYPLSNEDNSLEKINVSQLGLYDYMVSILNRKNIFIVNDLTKLSSNEVKKILLDNENLFFIVKTIVHNLGLFFIDEEPILKYYSGEIFKQLTLKK